MPMCSHACMLYTCVCTYMCMGRPEINLRCSSLGAIHLVCRNWVSYRDLEVTDQARLTDESISASSVLGSQYMP